MCKNNMTENDRIIKERTLWDKAADNYDKSSRYEEAYKLSIQKSRNIIKSSDKVLEIGCGTGIIAVGVADKADSVIGIDISPKMIYIANQKAEKLQINNIDFQIGDGYSVNCKDDAFDVILLFNSLHIVKEPDRVLSEAHRLLKQGGYLVTATDCYAEKVSIEKKMYVLVPKLMHQLGIISYLSNFRKKDITDLLIKNEFSILEDDIFYDAPLNYYVLAQKN